MLYAGEMEFWVLQIEEGATDHPTRVSPPPPLLGIKKCDIIMKTFIKIHSPPPFPANQEPQLPTNTLASECHQSQKKQSTNLVVMDRHKQIKQ